MSRIIKGLEVCMRAKSTYSVCLPSSVYKSDPSMYRRSQLSSSAFHCVICSIHRTRQTKHHKSAKFFFFSQLISFPPQLTVSAPAKPIDAPAVSMMIFSDDESETTPRGFLLVVERDESFLSNYHSCISELPSRSYSCTSFANEHRFPFF